MHVASANFIFLCCIITFCSSTLYGQLHVQYFDGADTLYESNYYQSSIRFEIDEDSTNIWQIGQPQKAIFNSAASMPNAILTDTLNYYPSNNSSSFQYAIVLGNNWGIGIMAIQWVQKLDMEHGKDFGTIEFSVDGGNNWGNVFDNPYVYSLYGFQEDNVDTLLTGEIGFTGVDSTWRNIWLCYDMNWVTDTLWVKHTFFSDSVDSNQEGWMMDNFVSQMTAIHTVAETAQEEYIKITPNPTTGRVNIALQKINERHIIEKMDLLDANGKLLERWENIPTKFFIDLDMYANGLYFLDISTNKKREVLKIVLQK